MINLTRASFQYENSDRGVQDISLSVKGGECVVLTGLLCLKTIPMLLRWMTSAKCWVESVDDWRIASWLNRRSDASR